MYDLDYMTIGEIIVAMIVWGSLIGKAENGLLFSSQDF